MDNAKLAFVKNEMLPLFKKLTSEIKPNWGVMNAQQMVEHFSETVRYVNGKTQLPLFTPEEHLPKLRAFMLSEKPFRENTRNPMLPEVPPPTKHATLEEAIAELETELKDSFATFDSNEELVTFNPIFGALTYEQNIHLLHKHAMHHLKQFGIID